MTNESTTTTTKQNRRAANKLMPMGYIKANLVICPESPSGLRWVTQRGSNKPGPAGSINGKGRCTIRIQGRLYHAHRVVYALHTGEDPGVLLVDHMDGNPLNNHPDNLRKATHSQNSMNKGLLLNNTSGVPGVYWNAWRGKWQAEVKKDGRKTAKRFEDLKDATAWVSEKRLELFGEFAPENRKGTTEGITDAPLETLNEPIQLQLFG